MNNNESTGNTLSSGILGDIVRYYRDFLDTDFKKTRLPKRQIARTDKSGNLVGVGIEKYPTLVDAFWKQISKPVGDDFEISFSRKRHTSKISKTLSDLIDKYISTIKDVQLEQLNAQAQEITRTSVNQFKDNPDTLRDSVSYALENLMIREIVVPLLNHLEPFFKEQSTSAFESLFDIEDELGQRLLDNTEESIGSALNTAIIDDNFNEVDGLLSDLFNPDAFRGKLFDYFSSFSANDFYGELVELKGTLNIKENMDIYLYIGDVHFNKNQYPLFYVPLHIEHSESRFRITVDPHLYINKKAIDYVAQELARQQDKRAGILVKDRIVYLESNQTFQNVMQDLLDKWCTQLALKTPIDLSLSRAQKSKSSQVVISNRLHFAAFDKSDESLLNDYEELLTAAEDGSQAATEFENIINNFLHSNPISVITEVDTEWTNTTVDERLIFRSPIPLNEEQRKIIMASNKPDCKLLGVAGPPGTGKSHCISTIAFDAILNGKNVLILSDKNEALDVVFDKITTVLSSVRINDEFVDPILRIGKSNNTYNKIISAQSIDQLRKNNQVAESKKASLTKHINNDTKSLQANISETIKAYESIKIDDLYALHKIEKQIGKEVAGYEILINDAKVVTGLIFIKTLLRILKENNSRFHHFFKSLNPKPNLELLMNYKNIQEVFPELSFVTSVGKKNLSLFNSFSAEQIQNFNTLLNHYLEIKIPLFGFLFSGRKARVINNRMSEVLDCRDSLDAHKSLECYQDAYKELTNIRQKMMLRLGDTKHFNIVFQQLMQGVYLDERQNSEFSTAIRVIHELFEYAPQLTEVLKISPDNLHEWVDDTALATKLDAFINFVEKYNEYHRAFEKIPVFDYTGDKSKIEKLHTQSLANTIDKRVVQFVDDKRTVAKEIRDIIRSKQKFPIERFDDLKEAFPCIIANIRDYSEYMPLKSDLFDIVVIDEASQVSIAQAFPAIIRAKKMIVLGDKNQFSNVKTSNASKEVNNQYFNTIRDNYMRGKDANQSVLNRLSNFNVKTSILDFIDNISNYSGLLKKHFRGYPELISFSSKYFYGGQLQAVKIRSKPIEEVIEYTVLDDDEKYSVRGNANENEAEYILAELEKFLLLPDPPSVGIITPFTDMQKYCAHLIQHSPKGIDIFERLHLKVMTFDSCQGEERDICFYPLVATKIHNRLNSIFPKNIEDAGDISETLRLQRLNVGFSRAKEKIHFVLSMPVEEYAGSIATVLRHYESVLKNAKQMPSKADVDPNSPMEQKVLDWLQQTTFYTNYQDNIEVHAQFPVGDYLRQLDHTYTHPSYRVDFLLKLTSPSSKDTHYICIEYDGFKEHFTDLEKVDASNYEYYYSAEDVEREKILESYGYKFLRINRFNLGKDPVVTLSERLTKLSKDLFEKNKNHSLIDAIQSDNAKLASGEMKICPKCKKPRDIKLFEDRTLKSGIGRICKKCKK